MIIIPNSINSGTATYLREHLSQRLSLLDIKEICSHLGSPYEYEDLADGSKSAKLMDLIDRANRRQDIPSLLNAITRNRPDIKFDGLVVLAPSDEDGAEPMQSSRIDTSAEDQERERIKVGLKGHQPNSVYEALIFIIDRV